MLRMILLGPQGSGKGTQAELLVKRLCIPQVSTGNILRENMQKGTELGLIAKQYVNLGKLVPDEVVIGIIQSRLKQKDAIKGFILDGYPRNIAQAQALDKITHIDVVLEIDVPDAESIRRISGRRTCSCGAVYHIEYNPPKKQGICDKCQKQLFQRDDDKEEAIRKRLYTYHNETKPIIGFYKERHIKIDGMMSIDEVHAAILVSLADKGLVGK
jgi:adenylate kinase